MLRRRFLRRLLLLSAVAIGPVLAKGKGPVGVHPLTDRYILVSDSNLDALLVLDLWGVKGVAGPGPLLLHPPEQHYNTSGGWVNPTGVSTCDACRYLYVSSTHQRHFYQIGPFDRPLREMALDGDFSGFVLGTGRSDDRDDGRGQGGRGGEGARVTAVWPWAHLNPRIPLPPDSDLRLRMVKVPTHGGIGYMASHLAGILRFRLDQNGRVVGGGGDVLRVRGRDGHVHDTDVLTPTGLSLSADGQRLAVAGFTKVLVLDVSEGGGAAPQLAPRNNDTRGVDAKSRGKGADNNTESPGVASIMHAVDVQAKCADGEKMLFRNALLVRDGDGRPSLYVDGHVGRGTRGGQAVAFHRLTLRPQQQPSAESPGTDTRRYRWDCDTVMGDEGARVGWRDGCGGSARVTRPHDVALLPGGDGVGGNVVVMTDIDNRAVRLMTLGSAAGSSSKGGSTRRIEANAKGVRRLSRDGKACVWTVSYDSDRLWNELYPNANVRVHSDNTTDEEGSRGSLSEEVGQKNLRARGRPYVLTAHAKDNVSVANLTYSAASALCQSSSPPLPPSSSSRGLSARSDLCSLAELRDGTLPQSSSSPSLPTFFWTKESCRGCWLHTPGTCNDGRGEHPTWDADYRMVASMVSSSGPLGGSRVGAAAAMVGGNGNDVAELWTRCIHEAVILRVDRSGGPVSVVCCGDSSSRSGRGLFVAV